MTKVQRFCFFAKREWPPSGPVPLCFCLPMPRGSSTHAPWGYLKSRPLALCRSSTCHARNIVRLASPTPAAPPLATPATSWRALRHRHRLRHLLPRLHHPDAPCITDTGCATSCHACIIVTRLEPSTPAAPPLASPATSCRAWRHRHRRRHLLPRLHHPDAPEASPSYHA